MSASTIETILQNHVAAMQKINTDGAEHAQRVSESHVRIVERYLSPLDSVADQIIPDQPKDATDVAAVT